MAVGARYREQRKRQGNARQCGGGRFGASQVVRCVESLCTVHEKLTQFATIGPGEQWH